MPEINVEGASSLYMKVEISNVRQSVSGNSSTVKFVASMRQTSGNNWNQVPGVDFKVVVNGSTKANQTGFFLDVRKNVTQVFYTADIVIPHNTDGTKSFSWSFWFDPRGTWDTYKPTTLSGTQALPRIARVSNATLSANTFDFGESFTVYTNQSDPSFTHTISYIRGTTVASLATGVKTSKAVAIPTAQISNYTTATTASMKIRTSTYSGSTLVGDYDLDVTVKVPSSAVPKIGAVSFTGSNAVFTANTQFIASKDKLKATVADVTTSYSSAIKKYLYRVQQRTTFSMEGTSNGATFPTFNFPATGSQVVNIQMAVVDARGRQSAWSTSPAIRVHAYQPPSIGAMTITRNANVTTVNVKRNWSVTPLYESGSTSAPKNTGALTIQYRTVGNSTWSNTGGNASGLSGVDSNVALSPVFAGGTSYEFQIKLTDKFQTTTAPIIRLGTEFVPLDIGPKGIGVGKLHSDGPHNLEVGSGGINSEGSIRVNGKAVQAFRITTDSGSPMTTVANLSNRVTGLESISTTTTNSPVAYGTVLGLGGFEILIGSDNSARFRRWSGSPAVAGPWLNAMDKDGTLLPSNANLNSYTDTGYYYNNTNAGVATFTNAPTNISAGYMEVYYGGTMVWQRWTNYRGTHGNKTFVRNAEARGANWGSWIEIANMSDIPTVPTISSGFYPDKPVGFVETAGARILYGTATAKGNATSTFNSLGNTVTFPQSFSSNTSRPIAVTYSITSNVTVLENRMITVNIRNVSRTGFTWDARDSASGTSPSGGTVYTLRWTAAGSR